MINREKGKVNCIVRVYSNGKKIFEANKMIMNAGLELLASRLYNNTDNYLGYVAIGTDNTAEDPNQTALGNEIFRKAVTSTTHSGGVTTITVNILYTEANDNWKEIGLFNDSTGGVMFDRVVVDYTKTDSDYVTIEFEITFAGV